jgi:hypothetical protein
MTTPVRVGGFVIALAVVFGLALGVGRAVGPVAEPVSGHSDEHSEEPSGGDGDGGHGGGTQPATRTDDLPGGLTVSRDGYTLRLADPTATAGRDVPLSFTVTGPDGRPVTSYDVTHEKRLHLIAVRRDFTGFQHVHPTLADDGTWSTSLDLRPGQWRVFADFKPTGADALTLGADLGVPGRFAPAPASGEQRVAHVDGYTVTLDGDLAAGDDARLRLTVEKDGEPVTDLEPYLGAYGHLVALREGDLAYLHVHPDGEPDDGRTEPGPDVDFFAEVPSEGGYRLFLDFKHDGVVRTAELALGTHDPEGGADDGHGPEPTDDGHAH